MNNAASAYLNTALMQSIDPLEFRQRSPYPWVNPKGFLGAQGISRLWADMPDLSLFTPDLGQSRKYGQASHKHYVLQYEEGADIAESWHRFIAELRGDLYRSFVCKLLGVARVGFRFQWHYTPRGGEVPPHCDAIGKIGTQIFYMNTAANWRPDWGGETLILDDEGKFQRENNPVIDQFPHYYPAAIGENSSLIFGRKHNSWHGMKAVNCPEGALRKVFIVIFEARRPIKSVVKKAARLLRGNPLVTRNERHTY